MILQNLGIPLYLQVKKYILDKINSGELKSGCKIPPERQLAAELGVSRNTVSDAYKELLLEGVLEARQGRGTFVRSESSEDVKGSRMDRALKIIDEAMIKVVDLGFSVEQFVALAGIRAKERSDSIKKLRIAIVDCTAEFIDYYSHQIAKSQVQIEKIKLADLISGKVTGHLLDACDMVVTTNEHQADVRNYLGASEKLLVVTTMPNMDSVVKLARLPANIVLGIVAESELYVEKVKAFVGRIAFGSVKYKVCLSKDSEEIRVFLESVDTAVVAKNREQLVRRLAKSNQNIISFYYEIDQGSLKQLTAKLIK